MIACVRACVRVVASRSGSKVCGLVDGEGLTGLTGLTGYGRTIGDCLLFWVFKAAQGKSLKFDLQLTLG